MSFNIFKYILIIFFFFSSTVILADEIVVIEIEDGWADKSGNGFALELFNEIDKVIDLPLELTPVPFARAIRMFQVKKAVCYLGGDETAAWDFLKTKVITSSAFLEGRIEVFTLRSQLKISDVKTLKMKKVGVQRSVHSLMEKLDHLKLDFDIVNSTLQNYKKLQMGRIDAFIGYKEHLPGNIIDSIHNDPGFVLYASKESLVCHENKNTQSIIEKFNKGLTEIKVNGTFQTIYKKYYGL